MSENIDYVIRDPEALKAHGGSKSKRRRDEGKGLWARRFKLDPDGTAVGWWASEIREAQERRRRQNAETAAFSRPRDKGRFSPIEDVVDERRRIRRRTAAAAE